VKLIAPNTVKPLWLTLSVLIFIGIWLLPTAGKYHGHILAWFWLAHLTGETTTTWRSIGGLLCATILFASLSLVFGWFLQRMLLAIVRLFRRHPHDDRNNAA
jgi:hypothetical protein